MALQTKIQSYYEDPNQPGLLGHIQYTWNDTNGRVTEFAAYNPTSKAIRIKAWPDSDPTAVYERIYPAFGTVGASADGWYRETLPQSISNKYGITTDSKGRLLGVSIESEYPYVAP